MRVPVLVLSGECDRIVVSEVGRAYAAATLGARHELLTATGHLPQLETSDQLVASLAAFTGGQ